MPPFPGPQVPWLRLIVVGSVSFPSSRSKVETCKPNVPVPPDTCRPGLNLGEGGVSRRLVLPGTGKTERHKDVLSLWLLVCFHGVICMVICKMGLMSPASYLPQRALVRETEGIRENNPFASWISSANTPMLFLCFTQVIPFFTEASRSGKDSFSEQNFVLCVR